ncbi:YwiC-like family protein [Paenibacillus ihuae]
MRKYIPNQHGAWAILILPFLLLTSGNGFAVFFRGRSHFREK